jgi:hypothetical protein
MEGKKSPYTGLRLTYPEVADITREDISQRQRAFASSGHSGRARLVSFLFDLLVGFAMLPP